MKKRVFVAMSGGVDSSVAAALLKKAGFSIVGVFMKPWSRFASSESSTSKSRIRDSQSESGQPLDCLWKQDREDALRVAAKLDVPLLTWDLSKEYEKYVVQYMIREYAKGLTPNPDVMCNKFIKFGVFMEKALKLGADYIATGHYVRKSGNKLLKAEDLKKDQSYFLYTLNQKRLKHCFFPIGDYIKSEVRKLAKKFGLPNWNKKDSQGVCFIGPLKVNEFLKEHIKSKRGLVLRKKDGKILGEHNGIWFYTVGQRHGFGLNVGRPHYIVAKDIKENTLYVDTNFENSNFQIAEFNWINQKEKPPFGCKVKTRYRQKDLDCVIVKNGSTDSPQAGLDKALIKIKESNVPIAPGQSAVFYKGNEVLGGGIIT